MHADRRRPKGITAVAILLVAVAVGGAVFIVLFTGFFRAVLSPYLLGAVGAGYTVSAAASAVGLWRMACWSRAAIIAWGGFAVVITLLMGLNAVAPAWRVVVMSVVAAATVAAIAAYVYRSLGGASGD